MTVRRLASSAIRIATALALAAFPRGASLMVLQDTVVRVPGVQFIEGCA